jgi:hypothetical protein
MLKRLAIVRKSIVRKFLPIVAVVVALIAIIGFVAHLNKDYDARAHRYSAKCVDGSEQSAGAGAGSLVCEVHDGHEAEDGKPNVAWWHVLITWPEGITTWAVILTLGAITWQAFLMRLHADHFEKLAEATKTQAEHFLASERAWITAEAVNFEEPAPKSSIIWIEVPITNHGKTPARVKRVLVTPQFIPVPPNSVAGTPGKLPEHPDYSNWNRRMDLAGYDLIIAPKETLRHIHIHIFPNELGEIMTREVTLYVHGTIEYTDTIGTDLHKTCFCSIYSVPYPGFNEPTGFTFSRFIPAAYFCAT